MSEAVNAMQKLLYRTDEEGNRLPYDHPADSQLIVAFVPGEWTAGGRNEKCNGSFELPNEASELAI